nr:MAG TPA: hypothetical protein [Caudoviricetes sp.]
MEERKYLNDTGLEHLVSKVKSALSEKQAKGDYAQLVNGKVPSGMLPAYVDDVVEFGGMPDKGIKILQNSTAEWTKVIYDSNTKKFYATKGVEVEDSSALTPEGTAKPKLLEVYDNWTERENFQELTTIVPYSGKIYIDTTGNKQYRWSGSELVEISSGGVALGETDSTAYPGNKGAANAEKIEGILKGDLPLASLSITPSWKAYTQTGEALTFPSTSNLSTIYGYKVTFAGKYKWTKDDAHKAPTAVAGGDWAAKALPKSEEFSEEITVEDITSDRTFTAKVSAKKQGLVLANGIIRQADSTDLDYSSASARVHFQYKCVAASVSEAAPSASTLTSLLTSVVLPTPSKKYELRDGKSKTATSVTTNSTSYYMYAYPSVLGNLSKIVMNDATPLLDGGFNLTKVTVTDPETKKELEYNVYTSVQRGAFTNAKLEMA